MNKYIKVATSVGLGLMLSISNVGYGYSLSRADTSVSVHRLEKRHAAKAPLGMMLFCLKAPKHCRGGGASEVRMTAQVKKALQSVNRSVNRSIRPRNDKGDVWSINVKSGDCEDYALTKRAKLISLGLPASALRLATARTRSGEGHAVLVVRTDKGDFVLDNRTGRVKEWHKTGLRWVAMASANPKVWQTI